MDIKKEESWNIKLEGSEEIDRFKSIIEKINDSENKIAFKSDGLSSEEKELVSKIKDKC